MSPPSLTRRLALLFGGTFAVIVALLGIAIHWASDHHFIEQDRLELIERAHSVARQISHTGGATSGFSRDGITASMNDHAHPPLDKGAPLHPLAVLHRDKAGKVLQNQHGDLLETIDLPTDTPRRFTTPEGTWRGMTVPVSDGQVRIAINIHHHDVFLRMLDQALLAFGLLASSAGLLLGHQLARKGLAPLDALARRTAEISATRLDARLDPAQLPQEVQALARELNDMLARLEDAFRRLTEFSSDLAHELRTPISNLTTATGVALSQTRSAEDYQRILESNLEEFGRLTRMVNDMLFLARADHGTLVLGKAPIQLDTELDALIEFYDALASDRHIRLHRTGSGTAQGDKTMLRRAFANLIANAIAYSPPGSEVRCAIISDGHSVCIEIDNPGPPIARDLLPRLFDRFVRGEASRTHDAETTQSSGLGLAIVRSIVQAHGGFIEALRAGELNRFRVTLPGVPTQPTA